MQFLGQERCNISFRKPDETSRRDEGIELGGEAFHGWMGQTVSAFEVRQVAAATTRPDHDLAPSPIT